MAERILKFDGLSAASQSGREVREAEPESDPRGRGGTTIETDTHFMAAVNELEPAATATVAYFGPDSGDDETDLERLQERVREGEVDLTDVMTVTDEHNALVNPRRSMMKDEGRIPAASDVDLWSVFTDNYQAMPPTDIFTPLAEVIDDNDGIPNDAIYGEFRERRNGGEVFGEVLFDTMEVENTEGDPVKLGLEFGWSYYGDRSFYVQAFAQQTRCRNSIRGLSDKRTVMHHNRSVNWGEVWRSLINRLGIVGDTLSQAIMDANELVYEFDPDAGDDSDAVPMTVEEFYDYAGFPQGEACRLAAQHAREAAQASGRDEEGADAISAWHLHSGATYWLSWYWDGSEDSRSYKQYRRTANDLLFNPVQVQDRVVSEYEDAVVERTIDEVLEENPDLDEEEAMELVEERLADESGIATVRNRFESLEAQVEQFRTTEERLDAMQEAMTAAEVE